MVARTAARWATWEAAVASAAARRAAATPASPGDGGQDGWSGTRGELRGLDGAASGLDAKAAVPRNAAPAALTSAARRSNLTVLAAKSASEALLACARVATGLAAAPPLPSAPRDGPPATSSACHRGAGDLPSAVV
jgi:hypothetical protein